MHTTSTIVSLALITALFSSTAICAEPVRADEIHAAVTRSIRFLEDDLRQWRNVRKCGACHHAPPALITLREAAAKNVAIDQAAYADLRTWSLTNDRARLLPKVTQKEDPQPDLSLQSVYLAWSLADDSSADTELKLARHRIGEHLVAAQRSDGFWQGPVGHPPVFASPSEVTLLVLLAANMAQQEPLIPSSAIDRAESWLQLQPLTDSHQELVFRILWRMQTGRESEAMNHKRHLVSLQQPDGGWRQTATMSSDAFATGQSLVALAAVGVSAEDPAVQRAAEFLVKTQQPDGTWTMISRPDPESGKPANNLNPITYAGAAWGVRGLLTLGNHPE